ncbi:hypothetical protein EIP91_003005 [Steccherinum ochraceum]|uniref:Uncharacterized protein n=1 Tax=Steccherinum ochraceum TaxID=92696 RepID=A0A4R0REM9_9APHY|nr:hypothetical protein EIP91_003005 [Steccherinum ochraceum]
MAPSRGPSTLPRTLHTVLDNHKGPVHVARYAKGSAKYVLTGGQDRTIRLWNPNLGTEIKTYAAHGYEVLSIRHIGKINVVEFNDDASVVASGSFDSTVRLWDLRSQNRQAIQTLEEARDAVQALHVGQGVVITGSVDGHVRTYDLRMGQLRTDFIGHPVTAVVPSQDNQTYLVTTLDSHVRLMDAATGKMLNDFTGHTITSYRCRACFGHGEATIIAGDEKGTVWAWDLVDAQPLSPNPPPKVHEKVITWTEHHPVEDGEMITASADGTLPSVLHRHTMCIGENSAPHAEHYLNAQLGALWENATECVSHHSKGLKPSDNQKYSFALAEYYFGKHRAKGHASKADMMFHASFGRPRIEFICNHDAAIHLSLQEGHFNTDFANASKSKVSAHHERNRLFRNVQASFRIPFSITSLRGQDGTINNGNHVIKLFVFDYQKATPIDIISDVEISKQALSFYLLHYLRFLSNAGHHILFSLPDFDDDKFSISIDFSTMSTAIAPIEEIHGVSIEKINAFLSTGWLKSAMLAADPHTCRDVKTALAEYRSTSSAYSGDIHFHVKMGAPRVKALCDQEVILYFTIDELFIHDSEDFTVDARETYFNWEIAVLVNVVSVTEEDGNITRCRLDFDTGRFVRQFCTFPDLDEDNADAVRVWTRVVEFFTTEYFEILETCQYHVIYHHDHRWPKPAIIPYFGHGDHDHDHEHHLIDASWEETCGDHIHGTAGGKGTATASSIEWKTISEKVDLGGFDSVTAISQGGIIAQFLSLWTSAHTSKDASLLKWSYDDFFQASFKPMTLRLLSNGRAIVWINLAEGFLRTLKNWMPWREGNKYSFEDWSLAFEVDIKMCNHTELHETESSWHTKFEGSAAYKEHGTKTDRVLKHIYLDFHSAEFVHEFSSFEGLFQSTERRPIDKVQAIVTYLKNHYFRQVTSSGYHILNTIPVWKNGSTPPSFGLTSVAFHVYSEHVLERHTWGAFSKVDEPVILVIGMTGFRTLPSLTLKFSSHWIAHAVRGVSYGSVCVSRKVFLEERLLSLLARVNALTTIVPLFAGVDNGAWRLELTTWAMHEIRKGRACNWVAVKDVFGALKYKWEHRDEWNYEHEGSDHIANGIYTTSCVTKNYLSVPTTFNRGALEIKLEGNVTVKMGYKGVSGAWGTQSTARWSSTVAITSGSGGLKIEVIGSTAPVFQEADTEALSAAVHTDPETLLKAQLPGTVELGDILGELKQFEGCWHGCYPGLASYELTHPVFNAHGDLLFKLRPFGVVPRSTAKIAPVISTTNGTTVSTTTTTVNGSVNSSANGATRKSSTIIKPRPTLRPQASRSSFLSKVKEIAHTVLVGEHAHPRSNGDSKKSSKTGSENGSMSDSADEDDGDVTESERIAYTID